MKGALFCVMLSVAGLVAGCVSSRPIDVELAEQNYENAKTTNEGTAELIQLLDEAKTESPDASWTARWDEGAKASHALQAAANTKVAEKVLDRAKKYNPEK